MTKQEMLDKIYEKIADKELSFGCKVKTKYSHTKKSRDKVLYFCYHKNNTLAVVDENGNQLAIDKFAYNYLIDSYDGKDVIKQMEEGELIIDNIKIIGHPIMLGDVLDYIEENKLDNIDKLSGAVLFFWTRKRELIDKQQEDCIKYIYNLIK